METIGLLGKRIIDRNTLSIGVVEDLFTDFGTGTDYVSVRFPDGDRHNHALNVSEIVVIGQVFKT